MHSHIQTHAKLVRYLFACGTVSAELEFLSHLGKQTSVNLMVMNSDVSYIGGMLQSQIHRYTLQTKQEMEQQEAMSLLSNRNGGFTLTPDEPSSLSFTFADDNSYFECP